MSKVLDNIADIRDIDTKAPQATTYTKSEVDTALGGKANTTHTHVISDVTNLQTSLDAKANSTNPSFTGSISEGVYNLTGTDISPANGTIQYKTLTANTTFTESLADGQSVTLMLNPSTFTTTWFTATWIGSKASVAPTLIASVYNCITFFQFGDVVYGKYEGRV